VKHARILLANDSSSWRGRALHHRGCRLRWLESLLQKVKLRSV